MTKSLLLLIAGHTAGILELISVVLIVRCACTGFSVVAVKENLSLGKTSVKKTRPALAACYVPFKKSVSKHLGIHIVKVTGSAAVKGYVTASQPAFLTACTYLVPKLLVAVHIHFKYGYVGSCS